MDKLKQMRTHMMLNAILTILIGILIMVAPGSASLAIALIAGIGILISGILEIYHYCMIRGYALFSSASLLGGIIKCILGIFLISHPGVMITFLSILISIFILFGGISSLESAMQMKQLQMPGWGISLVMAAIILIAGVFLLFFPFGVFETSIIFAGIILIVDGAVELYDCWRLRKLGKEFSDRARRIRDEIDRDFIDR